MTSASLLLANPWSNTNKWSASTSKDQGENFQKQNCDNEAQMQFNGDLAEIAKRELREDDATKTTCLEQFREWIKQNRDIENCQTDENFLLRFLRLKKYSVPMAQQVLLKYLNFRKRFHYIVNDLDYLNEKCISLIDNGYIFCSPFRDANGRRIIIYNLAKFDPHMYNSHDMTRAHIITYETIVANEENQILGVNHVADLGAIGPSFVTMWSITEFGYLIRWGEQSLPVRHKEMNMFNMPLSLKYIYDFAQTNIRNKKLKERFVIHNSLGDLHKRVNKHCLPLEMGGSMATGEMIQLWKEELAAKRDTLLTYNRMRLLSDRGIITKQNSGSDSSTKDNIIDGLPGSFRKLQVD